MTTAAEQIDRFLRDNPVGSLEVVVGFASPVGLRWLAERSEGREVRLLIGDIRTGFSRFSDPDRIAAIRFIRRDDVQVVNWYSKRGGHRTAHAKTWMIKPDEDAGTACEFLVGSANLTRKGLFENAEMMTRPHPDEHDRLHADMLKIMHKSWPIEDKLLYKLEADDVVSRSSASDGRYGSRTTHAPAPMTYTLGQSQTDARSADQRSSIPDQRPEHISRDYPPRTQRTKRKLARKLLRICTWSIAGLSLLVVPVLIIIYAITGWLDMVGL